MRSQCGSIGNAVITKNVPTAIGTLNQPGRRFKVQCSATRKEAAKSAKLWQRERRFAAAKELHLWRVAWISGEGGQNMANMQKPWAYPCHFVLLKTVEVRSLALSSNWCIECARHAPLILAKERMCILAAIYSRFHRKVESAEGQASSQVASKRTARFSTTWREKRVTGYSSRIS